MLDQPPAWLPGSSGICGQTDRPHSLSRAWGPHYQDPCQMGERGTVVAVSMGGAREKVAPAEARQSLERCRHSDAGVGGSFLWSVPSSRPRGIC